MAKLIILTLLLTTHMRSTAADFNCLCNYSIELPVYSSPDDTTTPIGYMYEFDCKPQYGTGKSGTDWMELQYEQKVGYVQTGGTLEMQVCPGVPSEADILSTTAAPIQTAPPETQSSTQTTVTATVATSPVTETTLIFTSTSKTNRMPHTSPPTVSTTELSTLPTQTSPTSTIPTTHTVVFTSAVTPKTASTTSTASTTTTTSVPITTNTPTTTTPTTTQTTHSTLKTTQTSITTTGNMHGDVHVCSSTLQSLASSTGGTLGQQGGSCYLLNHNPTHWTQAETWCVSHGGGHLVHIESQTEQTYLEQFLDQNYNHHSVWIGLHDRLSEGTFHWTSGDPVGYTHWTPDRDIALIHGIEDCVAMDTHNLHGQWDDRECDFEVYGYVCEYGVGGHSIPPSTQTSQVDGNTNLCQSSIQHHAMIYNGVLGQHGRGCYELLPGTKYSWEHAENICQAHGGHLAHISNQQEQDFVQGFLQRHSSTHAVWLGLNDNDREGQFTWTSGTSVSYTNWIPGHESNTPGGSSYEDCALIVPYKSGQWDDVHCGYEEIFGLDTGEIHYPLCQYKIHSTGPLIG